MRNPSKPALHAILLAIAVLAILPGPARARFYQPAVGRFVSPDSIVPNNLDPQSFNRYAYARNNPINMVDPDGHSWMSAIGKGVSSLNPTFAPTFTYNAWAGNIDSSRDFWRYAYQAGAYNGAFAWALTDPTSFMASAQSELALNTGSGRGRCICSPGCGSPRISRRCGR